MTLFNDVFGDDAFQFDSLTAAMQKLPYIENRLGQLGLFNGFEEGVETDTVVIDEVDGQIEVMQSRPRGADPQRPLKDKKYLSRAIKIPHFQFEDRVMAASLLGKRMPGMNVMQTVADKIMKRYQYMLNNMLAPSQEIHRLNALRGVLLDGDGTVIHDYFDFFGVTQVVQDFKLSVATTKVRELVVSVQRQVQDELLGIPFTGVRFLCGRNFFDAFTSHPAVRDTFLYQEGTMLRADLRKGFNFGGAVFEDYRGMRNFAGNLAQIDDDEAICYPEGVAGMYRTYYAPAGFLETVNELGQPMYARVAPDWKYNEHIDQLIETNPLYINTRPRAVLKITKS